MLELSSVHKTYRMGDQVVHALRDVSLTIEEGDFVAIMGPSGSGKSSLMNLLGLLDVPTSGSYLLGGRDVSRLSEDELAVLRRQEIGFIFQQFNLLPRLSATENVLLPHFYSRPRPDLEQAKRLLHAVGLGSRSGHKSNELSGGQQQRVAIARALVNQPRIIFADEPTGNLDSASEREIMASLRGLNEEGITLIMVTHEEEIGAQARRRIRMRDGRIVSDERLDPRPLVRRAPSAQASEPTAHAPGSIGAARLHRLQPTQHLRQGAKTLASNKVRTGLSMLGILIGVAAVIAMLAIGHGAQEAIEAQLSSLGSNLLVVQPGASRAGGVAQTTGSAIRLTTEDASEIASSIAGVLAVAPAVNGRGQVIYTDQNRNTQVLGTGPAFARMHDSEPVMGRFFTSEENQKRARVAVLGATVARHLFSHLRSGSPIGEYIKIDKVIFEVIGILPMKGASGSRDRDDVVVIPALTAMYRLLGRNSVDAIEVEAASPADLPFVEARVKDLIRLRHKIPTSLSKDAFRVQNMADLQAAMVENNRTMSWLLASIAGISLLVGGIGIMNIMLVSVTERTREIGLRKAIGARPRDILMQFMAESAVVSMFGGLVGIVFGWLITLVISHTLGWSTSISVESVLFSFLFSAGVGLVFGIYPARKAAALNPIEALRFE
jgi:macrolide transport system ATP-binding/permease protein